jgi:hypothetical protein
MKHRFFLVSAASAGSESPGGTEESRLHGQDRREDEGDEGPLRVVGVDFTIFYLLVISDSLLIGGDWNHGIL